MSSRRIVPKKASTEVVDYVLEELFEGRLRSGDRIDLDEMCEELGVSRLPVREAIVMLERDGIVSTKYHRGVFVEPFDGESIMDDFEVMGLLSGLAVRRLAAKQDDEVITELKRLLAELRQVDPTDSDRILKVVQQMMVLEHRAGGSRRLRAELRSFTGFFPWVFRLDKHRSHSSTVKVHAGIVRAIAAGDGDKAAQLRLDDFRDAGKRVVRELERRGVIQPR